MKPNSINYEELAYANNLIENIRENNDIPRGEKLYAVSVGVWVNGRLQFHGGDVIGSSTSICMGQVKLHSMEILSRMRHNGMFRDGGNTVDVGMFGGDDQ